MQAISVKLQGLITDVQFQTVMLSSTKISELQILLAMLLEKLSADMHGKLNGSLAAKKRYFKHDGDVPNLMLELGINLNAKDAEEASKAVQAIKITHDALQDQIARLTCLRDITQIRVTTPLAA